MTGNGAPEPEGTAPGPVRHGPEWCAETAHAWSLVAGFTADVPLPRRELVGELTRLLGVLADAMAAEPFDPAPATAVGEELVRLNIVGDEALRRSMELVGRALTGPAGDDPADRTRGLLAGVASGYAQALQNRTLVTQEAISRALLRAKEEVERVLKVSEERFREVFTASAVGILITDLDGHVVQHNTALRDMLGHADEQLTGRAVFDLLDPLSVAGVRRSYGDVLAGAVRRARRPAQLVGSDGEIVWTLLSISLLRDSDGRPVHYLTVVDNVSDLRLLAENVSRQGLYDVLTALPNRQFLANRLTELCGRPDSPDVVTLCHIGLDRISLINDGLGWAAGDVVLRMAAGRLRQAFAQRDAILARLGGDEFAVLVAHDDGDRDVDLLDLVRTINQALADPVDIGDRRVGVSATIGVARRRSSEVSAQELLREAETTVRRLKSRDKVQWGMFDDRADAVDRARARLVAAMPAALADGEIEPVFQPLVRLAGDTVAAAEARVEWTSPAYGVQDHDLCVALAEETTLALELGARLLRAACEQGTRWPAVVVNLTARQANDPDLISVVRRVVEDSGADTGRLRIGMPAAEVARSGSDAEDNALVLGELAIPVVLHGFRADDVHLLDGGIAVRGVVLADELLRRLGERPDAESLSALSLAHLVPLIRSRDLTVAVRGVSTVEQVGWLRRIGVDVAQGPYFSSFARTERSH